MVQYFRLGPTRLDLNIASVVKTEVTYRSGPKSVSNPWRGVWTAILISFFFALCLHLVKLYLMVFVPSSVFVHWSTFHIDLLGPFILPLKVWAAIWGYLYSSFIFLPSFFSYPILQKLKFHCIKPGSLVKWLIRYVYIHNACVCVCVHACSRV